MPLWLWFSQSGRTIFTASYRMKTKEVKIQTQWLFANSPSLLFQMFLVTHAYFLVPWLVVISCIRLWCNCLVFLSSLINYFIIQYGCGYYVHLGGFLIIWLAIVTYGLGLFINSLVGTVVVSFVIIIYVGLIVC